MKYDVRIRVGKEELSFGMGVVQLMDGIETYGSLSAAYKKINMSSSKAWRILKKAEEDLGFALVESRTGGLDGGKTILTQQGKLFLESYRSMSNDVKKFAEVAFEKYFSYYDGGNL